MTQRIRFQLAKSVTPEENDSLKNLLEKFINGSEELEDKENNVIQQVEELQVALKLLLDRKKEGEGEVVTSKTSLESVRLDLNQIEEETKKIREETQRIQEEVKQKIEENKKLQEEVDRRKALERGTTDEFVTDSFINDMEKESKRLKEERETFENRAIRLRDPSLENDPGIKYMTEKLKELEEMERRLRRESDYQTKDARKKRKELKEKIDMLEWESEVDKQLLRNFTKKNFLI